MTVRAGNYARISSDPDERRVGVDRQLADNAAAAVALGWQVVGAYVDNDRSAKEGSRRPEFERLLADVTAGTVDAIIGWDDDRIRRTVADTERLIVLARSRGLRVATRHGVTDLAVAHGQLTARIKTAVASYEITQAGERIRRAVEDRAARGLPHGGCAWGWQRAYDLDGRGRVQGVTESLDPVTGGLLREAGLRLLAGDSLRSIAADWQARGVPTPQQTYLRDPDHAAAWNATILRQLLRRPRNAGLRVHRGQVVGPSISEAAWDGAYQRRIDGMLSDPSRRTSVGNGRAVHLLSGIAVCGRCGHTLVTSASQHGRRVYVCPGCHRIRRRVGPVDEWVAGHVIAILARPDAAALLTRRDDAAAGEAAARAADLRARLDLVADQFAEGVIDGRQLARITGRLRPELTAVEAGLRAASTVPELLDLAGPDAQARWGGASLDRRRAVIRALVTVTMLPTVRGAGRFRPEHVRVDARI